MALDKVIDSAQLDADLTAVADAIRTKGGTTGELEFPSGFVSAVEGIQAGGGGDDVARSILDGSITEFTDNELLTLRRQAFYYCKNLKKATLRSVTTSGISSFQDCTGLESVDMPKLTKINMRMFNNCTALKNADFRSVTYVETYSLQNCAFEKLKLPSLTGTYQCCFTDCKKLTALILSGSTRANLHDARGFNNTPIATGTGYIYVPRALVDSYKSATNWSSYADQIRAIEDYPEICGEVSA